MACDEISSGYLAAIVAGFVLTAGPNWTGRLPLSGAPLAGLVALWVAGRLATGLLAEPVAAALIDASFLTILATCVWREIVVGRNWRNAPVALMLSLLAMAGLLHHLEAAGYGEPGLAIRLALGGIMLLLTLIGGRIVPSFTRNWLARQAGQPQPASFGLLDKAALIVTLVAVLALDHPPLRGANWRPANRRRRAPFPASLPLADPRHLARTDRLGPASRLWLAGGRAGTDGDCHPVARTSGPQPRAACADGRCRGGP